MAAQRPEDLHPLFAEARAVGRKMDSHSVWSRW